MGIHPKIHRSDLRSSRLPRHAVHRLRIAEVAFGGRGVGRLEDGRVVFVPFVIAGEMVRVEIVRERKSYLEARLLEIEDPSPQRVEPPCPYFGHCGGCSYQHMSAPEQLRVKRAQAAQVLRRIGRFENPPVEAAIPSPKPYAYRNRITVHARGGRIGFFGQDGRDLVDIARCPIAEPAVNEALARFRAGPPLREGNYTLRADPDRRTFQQTNDAAAAELLALVERLIAPIGGECLIDAYCGAGFFIKRLRERFERVVGLEWDARAVAAARRDALPHEEYLCGDAAEHHAVALQSAPLASTWLVTDPPSEGLSDAARRAIGEHPPAHWIYVSCNPSTLARDLAELRDAYDLLSVTPLDMFPQTAEIEVIARLRAKQTPR
jgi:23S rRNA (uracil1939-C5)-methyltransferase